MTLNQFIDDDSHQSLKLHYNLIKVEKRLQNVEKTNFFSFEVAL